MTLKGACISREGDVETGTDVYNDIINECSEALDSEAGYESIESILYDAGFEPDYIMDVLDAIS